MTLEHNKRVVLVTGASRGIGFSLARALALSGAHVVAVARTKAGLEELDDAVHIAREKAGQEPQEPLTLVPMDLRDYQSIDRLGAELYARFARLDGLVLNAAVLGALSPLGHLEPKGWEETISLNLTAQWRLIRSLDPLLQRSPAGRVLALTSGVTKSFPAYWGGYTVSKAGLEALVKTYGAETLSTPIRVALLNPGPTRTRMRAQAMPGEDPQTLPHPDDIAAFALPLLSEELQTTGEVFTFQRV